MFCLFIYYMYQRNAKHSKDISYFIVYYRQSVMFVVKLATTFYSFICWGTLHITLNDNSNWSKHLKLKQILESYSYHIIEITYNYCIQTYLSTDKIVIILKLSILVVYVSNLLRDKNYSVTDCNVYWSLSHSTGRSKHDH